MGFELLVVRYARTNQHFGGNCSAVQFKAHSDCEYQQCSNDYPQHKAELLLTVRNYVISTSCIVRFCVWAHYLQLSDICLCTGSLLIYFQYLPSVANTGSKPNFGYGLREREEKRRNGVFIQNFTCTDNESGLLTSQEDNSVAVDAKQT